MPKPLSSAIGIDLGQHSLKAVHLQRKGRDKQLHLTAFASRVVGDGALGNAEQLAHHLKLLLKDLGVSTRAYAIAVSSPQNLLRIIEQPPTPTKILREALRLHGLTWLNQDCKDFVLDCDMIPEASGANGHAADHGHGEDGAAPDHAAQNGPKQFRYLVGGLPRTLIEQIDEACVKCKLPLTKLQIGPIANYNAFESSLPEVFAKEAFMLVDIGHLETRVFVGSRKELVLVRSVEYGGRTFLDAVSHDGAIERDAAITLVEQGDAGMTDTARESLSGLAHELRSSIGFFEGQREQVLHRVHFSGALVNAEMPLQILSDELEMPCDTWDPFVACTVSLPKSRQGYFDAERAHLNVACGAALELLQTGD